MNRHTASSPCPVCGGHPGQPRGRGIRCVGFVGESYAWCTREEFAGKLLLDRNLDPPAYRHSISGECACGEIHSLLRGRPSSRRQAPPQTRGHTDPDHTFEYREADGTLVALKERWDGTNDRRKDFQWRLPGAIKPGLRGRKHDTLPLFGAELLSKSLSATVWILEGELKTLRLREAFTKAQHADIAVSIPGGADQNKFSGSLDVLKGRTVVLWPDNDEKGRASGLRLQSLLTGVVASISVVEIEGLPEKGDAVDYFDSGRDVAELLSLVRKIPSADPHLPHPGAVRLSEVTPKAVDWLWDGYIPRGMLTIVDGDAKTGKTTISIDIGARVTTGQSLPDGTAPGQTGGVVFWSCEDSAEHTIRPRMEAAGADIERVYFRDRVQVPGEPEERLPTLNDLETLRRDVIAVDAALVIIDPLTGFLPSGTDFYKDPDIRRVLAPIAQLAADLNVAIVMIRHPRKAATDRAIHAGGGSVAITAAARSALIAGIDRRDTSGGTRVLAPAGSNLSGPKPSLSYRIVTRDVSGVEAACIEWLGPTSLSADELVQQTHSEPSRSTEAVDYLRRLLCDGPVLATEAHASAESEGIARKTLERAKGELGVQSLRKEGRWYWALPEDRQDRHEREPSTDDDLGHINAPIPLFGPDQP